MPVHHGDGHSYATVFSDSYTVAVETHSNTTVCVPSVYEVPGKVEVSGDY